MIKISHIKYFFFIPSFYGFVTILFTYLIFLLDVIDYNPISFSTHFIIIFSIFSFFISTILYYNLNKIFILNFNVTKVKIDTGILIILYSIGYLGVYLYLNEYFSYYGGYLNYFLVLFSDTSSELRSNGQIASESIGIQLTYAGWIAIGITFFHLINNRISKLWMIPLIITFICNLFFIDRTRPMWILLIVLYILFCSIQKRIKLSRLLISSFISIFSFLLIFIFIGNIAGKTTEVKQYKGWDISPNAQNIVFYLTSSYVYLDYIINNENPQYEFDRTINPALKLLKAVGLTEKEPSSRINEFYGNPYQTNVGTFLEPFYRDFGLLFMLFAVFIHSIFLNHVAFYFLKLGTPYSLFLVSNICIIDFFSFFTPKLNNFPIWFFFSLGFMIVIKKMFLRNG
jgi:oligosaccharide repeat unit polymerase